MFQCGVFYCPSNNRYGKNDEIDHKFGVGFVDTLQCTDCLLQHVGRFIELETIARTVAGHDKWGDKKDRGGPMTVYDVVAKLEKDFEGIAERERDIWPVSHNRASELGHPCLRYLFYLRDRWQDQDLPTTGLQKIFAQGRAIEREVIKEVMETGMEWVWGQRAYVDSLHCISGKIDGGVSPSHNVVIPAEIKSMQGPDFDRIHSLQDFAHHPKWYVRKYPTQIGLYLYLSGEKEGIIILKDKWYWRTKFIPVTMDDVKPYVDQALADAEIVNDHLSRDVVPERMEYDDQICGRCRFKTICLPPFTGRGTAFIDDEKLLEDLDIWNSLKVLLSEFNALDKSIKKRVRQFGEEALVGGQFVISNKVYKKKRLKATGEMYDCTVTRIRKLEEPVKTITETLKEGE